MLTQLNIKGLAIIDELSIEFTQKFNVITGETGAGKSILIKALNLILGAKATGDVVRKGNSQACVTGTFTVAKIHLVTDILENLGIALDDDHGQVSIIMRRSITSKGRSLAWINDIPVTLLSLREVAIALIDMFGQHENQKILDVAKHVEYLDQFITDKSLRDAVRRTHKELARVISELRKLLATIEERKKNQDYISFRSDALEQFDPSIQDFQQIQTACRDAGSANEIHTKLGEAQRILDQAVGGDSLSSALWSVSNILERIAGGPESFSEISRVSADIASQIDDLSFCLGKSLSRLEVDEEDLEQKQARLADYQAFFRKMGVRDVEGLIGERERLISEIELINDSSARISQFLSEGTALARKLSQQAFALREARLQAAAQVKSRVEAEFLDLAMPGATFDVEFLPVVCQVPEIDSSHIAFSDNTMWGEILGVLIETGEFGTERANFMLSANPGEPSLPLQKVASGGEVSRIMLALKKALATGTNTCILVFDEIDTGISGRVATLVGKKMHDLSKHFQIICISHLPQVAAFADAHFFVHKFGRNERTESTITRLSEKDSVAEVARLLSGESVGKASVANAKSLIKKATDLVGPQFID